MTNLGESAILGARQLQKQQAQKQPLIPPARIRTSPSGRTGKTHLSSAEKKHNQQQQQQENILPGPEAWTSAEELFWDHMKEVENKWSTLKLNDDIWAKLIYFEQNCRLAKAYVSAPVLTIDNSSHGLDGFRIGLTGIDNTYRNLDSVRCLKSIGMGIKLKIDNQGNILIRRVGSTTTNAATNGSSNNSSTTTTTPSSSTNGSSTNSNSKCSVWVKDWPMNLSSASSTSSLAEGCTIRELDLSDTSYKLFDMRKFRLQLEKRKLISEQQQNHSTDDQSTMMMMDWRQCVSIISFVHITDGKRPNSHNLLEDPCWLMIINIIAIDMLKSSFRDGGLMSSQHGAGRQVIVGANRQQATRSSTASLIQQHQSLFSVDFSASSAASSSSSPLGNSNNNNNNSTSNKTSLSGNMRSSQAVPLRTSSSTSILIPSAKQQQQHTQQQRQPDQTTTAGNNNPVGTNERIKKIRTAANWYKLSPLRTNNSSYQQQQYNAGRRYQSTQQLSTATVGSNSSSSNNTIYTTFNSGKYYNSGAPGVGPAAPSKLSRNFNYPSIVDTTSTSDFNFVSHSTSSVAAAAAVHNQPQHNNYWSEQQQAAALYPAMSSRNNLRLSRADKTRIKLPTTCSHSSVPSLEPKSLSLSTFDLTQRRLDLRSSIKMNYDDNDVLDKTIDDTFDFLHHSHNNHLHQKHHHNHLNYHQVHHHQLNSERGPAVRPLRSSLSQNKRVTSDPKIVINGASDRATDELHHHQQLSLAVNKPPSSSVGDEATCFCCSSGINGNKNSNLNVSHEHINHNECQATRDSSAAREASGAPVVVAANTSGCASTKCQHQHHHIQKVSRSSIDSSSSSSGCADNDYFMSHSSSSMSSSTASNERELFSQPASSSGIVCGSGNTSDEYDEASGARKCISSGGGELTGCNHNSPSLKVAASAASAASTLDKDGSKSKVTTSAQKEHQATKQQHVVSKRGSKIKTIEPDVGYCCGGSNVPTEYDCDCPSVEYSGGCDCCCTCLYEPTTNTSQPDLSPVPYNNNHHLHHHQHDDEHSGIYNRLPHPTQAVTCTSSGKLLNLSSTKDNGGGKISAVAVAHLTTGHGSSSRLSSSILSLSSSATTMSPSSSPLSTSSTTVYKTKQAKKVTSTANNNEQEESIAAEKDSTTTTTNVHLKSTKELNSSKTGNGWLEKRRYSKILPKFIFSSSSSSGNRQRTSSEFQQDSRSSFTQLQKSSTLDKDGKYHLIRSTQGSLD